MRYKDPERLPDTVIPDSIKDLAPEQLYDAIYSYPADAWVDSLEYQELMSRLHTMTVDELEAEGYWVPCWKHNEAA